MKKTTGLILAILMTVSLTNIYSQDCVSCVDNTVGDGKYANAMGRNNYATGYYSSAIGRYNQATGNASFAFGFTNISQGNYSVAIGSYIQTGSIRSMVIGAGHSTNNKLINNYGSSLMVGFNSDVPTFFVGGSSGTGKTGKVCIGNINALPNGPQAKLHLKSDNEEVAAMFIEPYLWDDGSSPGGGGIKTKGVMTLGTSGAYLLLGNANHWIGAKRNVGLIFNTEYNYLFNEGNIGIHTTNPRYSLHVAGSFFTERFTLYNEQSPPREGSILQCDNRGNAYWNDPLGFSVWNVNEHDEAYRMSYVGIGTNEPQEMLDVAGNILVNDAIIGKIPANKGDWYDPDFLTLKGSVNTKSGIIMIPKGNNLDHNAIKIINPGVEGGIQFINEGLMKLNIRRDEAVFGRPDHKLQVKVNGKVWANEVEVQLTDWWDEVFDENYKLMPLHQLESFIEANNHLPDIPTEKDVLENGIELGEMNALLLKKVEELTLYIIEQQKAAERQNNKINTLEKRLNTLEE